MAVFSSILAATEIQKQSVISSDASLKEKSIAVECSSAIDSIFSNAATSYSTISCGADGHNVSSGRHTSETIPTVSKKDFLEVTIDEHYIE